MNKRKNKKGMVWVSKTEEEERRRKKLANKIECDSGV